MTRLASVLAVALVSLVGVKPAGVVAQPSTRAPVTVPFELVARHILIKTTIGQSRPLSFLLDTGANVAIVRMPVAKELGLTLYGSVNTGGAGAGTQAGHRVKDAKWSLVGLEGFSQPVSLALPLPLLPRGHGQDVDGIIGGEFIKEFVLELDYQARSLTLHDRGSFRYGGTGEVLPLELNSAGHAVINATVTAPGRAPIEHRFHLDTGSGAALILHSPFVNEHDLMASPPRTIRTIGMSGAGGASLGRTGRVASLRIGSFELTNPITIFSQDKAGSFADRSLAGNIGFGIASRFRLFLDYGRRRIILEPSSEFDKPFDRAHSGMALVAEGADYRTFRVVEVLEASPASEAGIQKDDVITAIDGMPAASLTLTRIGEMLEQPLARQVAIRRGDQPITVKMTPRSLV